MRPGLRLRLILLIAVPAAVLMAADGARSEDKKPAAAPQFKQEHLAFFESQVLPILKENCFKCHGGKPKIKGKLRLTSRAGIVQGGESGDVVDLKEPSASALVLAINYEDGEMPPKGKLPAEKIALLTKWVELGLPYTEEDYGVAAGQPEKRSLRITDETRNHWAFRPVARPQVPRVQGADAIKNPIDAFLQKKLAAARLSPNGPADKVALLRRAYHNLTGLPPKPEEMDAFLADDSPAAYEKVVDRLLESLQYGERWGRHWLDLVHYAESNSFERDDPKPEVWRYRDYVIRSFNEDKPYDQFVREQLAGDELPQVTPDSIIATGYYRLGLWDDESADPPLSRYDEMDDWVTITSQVFLGLTMNCARCHDHKLDPIPQEDYYRFLAFFHGVKSFQNGPDGMRQRFNKGNVLGKLCDVLGPAQRARIEKVAKEFGPKLAKLNKEIAAIEGKVRPKLAGGVKDDFKYESNQLHILREFSGRLITVEELNRYESLVAEKKRLQWLRSINDANVLCANGTPKPPPTHVKVRGNPGVNGKEVQPGFPQVLGFADPKIPAPASEARSSGRRRVLANWLTDSKNPVSARVMVNRLWQHHFGRGIVRTPNNFGLQGRAPTHPLLLDWLAADFVSGGWRIKRMHKIIMLSMAYQMSSRGNDKALAADPQNDLFWRYNMRRLTAEEIRDSILAVNGRLNLKMGGRSFYPEIPKEVLAGQSRPGQNWGRSSDRERGRRSVYIHVKRSMIVPFLEQFDAADTDNTCPVRFATTVPTQALGMLNSKFMSDSAKVFAERLKKEAGDDPAAQVKRALRLTLSRKPTDAEIGRGVELMKRLEKEDGVSRDAALQYYCLLSLNLNEFVYLD